MAGYEVIGDEELQSVKEVFENGGVLFRHGFDALRNNSFKVREFELAFAKRMKTEHALAVSSGTAALRVALASIGASRGDEIITQSFTFVATVEAIVESGATPVCTEINETLNMDPASLLKKITPATKAVIVVHMLGTPANLTEIRDICRDHNIWLIEDTAWGCGGSYEGTPLGSFGDIGAYSFDYAKTMTTGEGGMVTFRDEDAFNRAAAWHDHGHENNPDFPRWEDTRSSSGFNFRMMELQGAIGLAQLAKLDKIVEIQRQNAAKIRAELAGIDGIEWRPCPANAIETSDSCIFLTDTKERALRCRGELLKVGISTKILPEAVTWHFAEHWEHIPTIALDSSDPKTPSYPLSSLLLDRAVSIPINVKMDQATPELIRSAIEKAMA